MIEKLLLKLQARDKISRHEERALRTLPSDIQDVRAGTTIIHAGEPLHHSVLILEGFMCRYKDLRNGDRQIMELQIPGDFADLHSFILKRLDHGVMALTASKIARVPHDRLGAITEKLPHLSRMLWFSTTLDAANHRAWIVSLGARSAMGRLAHVFCELHVRLGIIRGTDGLEYPLPLSQTVLSECLGLTSVHVNRMLKLLRDEGFVTFRNGIVRIHDLDGLRKVAQFDPTYLYLEQRPL